MAKFAPHLAELSAPIRELLRKDRAWIWSAAQEEAFSKIKTAICSAPTLAHYEPNRPTLLCADSSSFALRGALLQLQPDDTWRPVTYVSRSLSETKIRYAQIDKEALAITRGCERLADYLVELTFRIHNNHKPLQCLLSSDKLLDAIPPRIQRFCIRLMRFQFTISYVPGVTLCMIEAFSHLPLPSIASVTIDDSDVVNDYVIATIQSLPIQDSVMEDIRQATLTYQALCDVIRYCQSTWPPINDLSSKVRLYAHSKDHLTYGDGILMFDERVVVPSALRPRVLDALHAAYQGIVKSRAKARQTVWWPKIGACIEQHIGACATCAHWRPPVVEPLLSSQLPNYPRQKVATDLFEHNGKHYITVVDFYSRYLELIELRSQTAAHVINTLKAIFARHGIPAEVRSDNGPCYAAHDFQLFAKSYGFNHVTSKSALPASKWGDGMGS